MNLKEARFRHNLTQYDVSLITGIHQSRISLIESGYILPAEEENQNLAKALGVDPGELEFELKTVGSPWHAVDNTYITNN